VGANASAKSTLLRAMARLVKPRAGAVLLDGADVASLPTRDVIRRVGFLPQSPTAPEGLTVADLVARGRYPHQRLGRAQSAHDRERIARALHATGTAELRDRPLDQLSGGQRRRVWIAMVLAQDTELLLLDEPTTYSTSPTSSRSWTCSPSSTRPTAGRSCSSCTTSTRPAATRLVAMRDGRVHAAGEPREIVDAELVHAVLNLRAEILADPVSGAPLCIPLSRAARAASAAAV
jgi:iron complex transport system ATP-binding protein